MRERNRRQKTQLIASAALELFIERGIERVTIEEIARSAGIAKGGFYRYFDDRAAVVAALMEPLREALDAGVSGCRDALNVATCESEVSQAYTALALSLAALLIGRPRELLLYLQESRGPGDGDRRTIRSLSEHVGATATELTRIAQHLGLVKETPYALSALAVVGASERLLYAGLTNEIPLEPMATAGALVELILDGVRLPDA